jgi:N-acetylglucosamine repressor
MNRFRTQQYSDNQKKLLQLISSRSDVTRQGLVQISALSGLTVNRFIAGFIADGLVVERGAMESKGGRKPAFLEINPDYACMVAIDVGASAVRTGLVSLAGRIVEKTELAYPSAVFPATVLTPEELLDKIQYYFDTYKNANIIGIGFGISGLVDEKEGKIVFCPNISGYDNCAMKSLIERRFNKPALINTSARCMALAEQRYGAGRNMANQVFVSLGYSISSGIIINSRIFAGSGGFSGEVGHLAASSLGCRCTCGNLDCLETHATLPEIIARIARQLKQPNVFSIVKNLVNDVSQIDAAVINRALAGGDKVVYSILDDIGTEIGHVLTSLTNILNPEIIILGGGVIESFPILMESITRTLKQRTLITNQQNLKVLKSRLGFDCGLIGSATQVINAFFS